MISYIPKEYRRGGSGHELEDLLYVFAKLGGDPAFLLRVLENYNWHPLFFIGDSNPKFHASCDRKLTEAAQMLQHAGFPQNTIESVVLCAAIHGVFVKLRKDLCGNPVQSRRYYWAGALIPYLVIKTGAPRWRWIESWINYLERRDKSLCHSLRISIPKGTAFLKQKSPDPRSTQQKITYKSLLLGAQAGIVHIGNNSINSTTLDSLVQRIHTILRGRRIGQFHAAHYKLIKNMYCSSKPIIPKDKTASEMGKARILNELITSEAKSIKVRRATNVEIKFYRRAISIWPELKSGLKAAALQSRIGI